MKAFAIAAVLVFAAAAAQADTAQPTAAPQAAPPATTAAPAAPKAKSAVVRHAKYDGGEGSVVRTGRNAYSFAGNYGKCQYRGYVNATGYHLDRSC